MGKYRTRLDIVADILSVVSMNNNSAGKTRIMYLANLSWEFLNRYLNELMEAGLLSSASSNCYRLTLKGERFLEKYGNYRKRHKWVEGQLSDVESERLMLENMFFNVKEVDGK
jgi:predicted transcriptional regulator